MMTAPVSDQSQKLAPDYHFSQYRMLESQSNTYLSGLQAEDKT